MEKWERVNVFGPRIANLIVVMIASTHAERWNAISNCTNLSGLICLNFDETRLEHATMDTSIISVLSCLSTASLKQLSLYGFRATKESATMIAAASSNLVSIRLGLAEPVQDGTILKVIVDSNPYLREVHVVENETADGERDVDSAVELLRVLVDTFSKCRSFVFGILNTGEQDVREETIRDICGSLPCRGIDLSVEIGSTFYRQTRCSARVIVPL